MSRPTRLHFTVLTRELNAYAMHVVTDRRNLLCYRCAEYGHRKAECMTWKTKLCWHAHAHAPATECPFAHGEADLRCPWRVKCVRIFQCAQRGRVYVAGCKSSEHTYRDCPHRTDVEPAPRFPPGLPVSPWARAEEGAAKDEVVEEAVEDVEAVEEGGMAEDTMDDATADETIAEDEIAPGTKACEECEE